MDTQDRTVAKIAITGEATVGKTSLRRNYLGKSFDANYIKTLGCDFSFKDVTIDSETHGFMIWDLAGHIQYHSVHPMYYRGAHGAIVVYDVAEPESFRRVEEWIRRILAATKMRGIPILIIGNKTDLIETSKTRCISQKEQDLLLHKLTEEYQDEFPILSERTSAMDGINVEESFQKIAEASIKWLRSAKFRDAKEGSEPISLDSMFPAAYSIVFNEVEGPVIIGSSPEVEGVYGHDAQAVTTAIKVVTSVDFADVIAHGHVAGSMPWLSPQGTLFYLAFVIDKPDETNPELIHHGLHIVGVVGERSLLEPYHGYSDLINGFLLNAMNEYARLLDEWEVNLTKKRMAESELLRFSPRLTEMLLSLRQSLFNAFLTP